MSLADLTLSEAAALLREGKTSSLELTEACLARIDSLDPTLRAFLTTTPDLAHAAARAADIKPVAVKSIEQQGLQALHRLRSGWMSTRTRRINTLRGFCREFGLEVRVGAVQGLAAIARLIADDRSPIPALLRVPMRLALEEIRLMEARIEQLERELGMPVDTKWEELDRGYAPRPPRA